MYFGNQVLGEIGPAAKDAVPALVQALKDPDDMVRGRAEVTLRRIDPSVLENWEQTEKAAAEEEARLRKEAAQRPAQTQRRELCKEEMEKRIEEMAKGGVPYIAIYGARQKLGDLKPCPKEGDEARKAAANQFAAAFKTRYGVRDVVWCGPLSRNPFAFEGVTIGLKALFVKMVGRDIGIFRGRSHLEEVSFGTDQAKDCPILVSEIPQGVFGTQMQEVVLAAKVLGRSERWGAPHLQFSGIHMCREQDCADFFGPESLR